MLASTTHHRRRHMGMEHPQDTRLMVPTRQAMRTRQAMAILLRGMVTLTGTKFSQSGCSMWAVLPHPAAGVELGLSL